MSEADTRLEEFEKIYGEVFDKAVRRGKSVHEAAATARTKAWKAVHHKGNGDWEPRRFSMRAQTVSWKDGKKKHFSRSATINADRVTSVVMPEWSREYVVSSVFVNGSLWRYNHDYKVEGRSLQFRKGLHDGESLKVEFDRKVEEAAVERLEVWTTATGEEIPIPDLEDSHLFNILAKLAERMLASGVKTMEQARRACPQLPALIAEAQDRELPIPDFFRKETTLPEKESIVSDKKERHPTVDLFINGGVDAGKMAIAVESQEVVTDIAHTALSDVFGQDEVDLVMKTQLGRFLLDLSAPLVLHGAATELEQKFPLSRFVAASAGYAYRGQAAKYALRYGKKIRETVAGLITGFRSLAKNGALLLGEELPDELLEPEKEAAGLASVLKEVEKTKETA